MHIADIDMSTKSPEFQMVAAPFVMAYTRPYPPAVTWQELRKDGFTKIEHASCGLADIVSGLDEIDVVGYFHLDKDGNVRGGDVERDDWVTRRIHQWSRK